MTARRGYGTGSLIEKHGAWYGRWRTPDGRRLSRRVGPVRSPGTDLGLTRRQAEAQLRKLMLVEEARPTPPAAGRHTVDDAAAALIEHKRVQGVSRSYLATLGAAHRRHFGPMLGSAALRKVHRRDVEAMSAQLLARGLSPGPRARRLTGALVVVLTAPGDRVGVVPTGLRRSRELADRQHTPQSHEAADHHPSQRHSQ